MKYKVGDKVRVRKDLEVWKMYGAQDFIGNMEQLKGKVVTIDTVCEDGTYFLKEFSYLWTDEMLEPVEDIIEYKGKKYDVLDFYENEFCNPVFRVIEHKEEILDEAEKRYLRNVIKYVIEPTHKEIVNIIKCKGNYSVGNYYYIEIRLKYNEALTLPDFKDKRMYKGMELDEPYTLEQLGLGDK